MNIENQRAENNDPDVGLAARIRLGASLEQATALPEDSACAAAAQSLVEAGLSFRKALRAGDIPLIRELVQETGVFSGGEVALAEELLLEGYRQGASGYYQFLIAERSGNIEGYVCFAQIGGTIGSFEAYWIAVRKESQGTGIGRRLMAELEDMVRQAGGKRVFVGTSSRAEYDGARRFYAREGYSRAAVIEDFFDVGDHEVYFVKRLEGLSRGRV